LYALLHDKVADAATKRSTDDEPLRAHSGKSNEPISDLY
jgi:hypothetical protein